MYLHGFLLLILLAASSAFTNWGQLLRSKYGKRPSTRTSDIVIETLGYWTGTKIKIIKN